MHSRQNSLKEDYIVIDISFEGKEDYFRTLDTLTQGLFFEFQKSLKRAAHPDLAQIFEESGKDILPLRNLGERISLLCRIQCCCRIMPKYPILRHSRRGQSL